MDILLTGTTGYIGKRLLPMLLKDGHTVICSVRDAQRFDINPYQDYKVRIIEVDYLKPETLSNIPKNIDVAYYLIHSMSTSLHNFENLETQSAENFKNAIEKTNAQQVIYLSGIVNDDKLSKHLQSRKKVEDILSKGSYALTTLRAGIIVGSGSASFEIIRDLVEKLPVMITPKWLNTRTQPIAVQNVLEFLEGVALQKETFNRSYDIAGPEVLTYKEMLLRFARARNLRRFILTIPLMTPRLSSYWLYFVTSTSYKLAVNLVNSMKVEVIGEKNDLANKLEIQLISYDEAIQMALDNVMHQSVVSSWTDAQSSAALEKGISKLIEVPVFGCFKDKRSVPVHDEERTLKNIWTIGGSSGWYYANWLWNIRGFLDKMFGGVGLRRGRTNNDHIHAGDALDFWRVIYANKKEKRLLLFAEMKLPGEAWLEFNIEKGILYQTATFRPLGLMGRLYWYMVLPFHAIIFKGLIKKLSV